MITDIIQRAKEQCETVQNKETLSADTAIKEPTVDTSGFTGIPVESDLSKGSSNISITKDIISEEDIADAQKTKSVLGNVPNDINENPDNQNSQQSSQTISINNDSDDINVDRITPGKASDLDQPDELIKQTSSMVLLSIKATPSIVDEPITNKKQPDPSTRKTSITTRKTSIAPGKAAQTKRMKTNPSTKTFVPKNAKQPNSKQTTSKPKQGSTSKGAKQSSKKPNKVDQDWKKTILQKVKK